MTFAGREICSKYSIVESVQVNWHGVIALVVIPGLKYNTTVLTRMLLWPLLAVLYAHWTQRYVPCECLMSKVPKTSAA